MIEGLTFPVSLANEKTVLTLRRASHDDLLVLTGLLADDPVSAGRGDQSSPADMPAYQRALAELMADSSNEILMIVNEADDPIATMQLTRIPGMARRGSTRLLVEAVRVASEYRSGGVGSAMMRWVIGSAAPAIGSSLVQLTSDEARVDAHRFYERLGFVGSHRGFKFRVE